MIALLAATALTASQPSRSILFVGNSFTFGADSDAMTYRKDSVTDLNGDGMGGVPALFKRFADQAGLLSNPDLAVRRMRQLLAVNGIENA